MSLYRRLVAVAVLAVLVVAGGVGAPVPSAAQPPPERVPGRYVVVLRDTVPDPGSVAAEHRDRHAAEIHFVYRVALKGYAATIPDVRLDDVKADPRVRYVSEDRPVSIFAQSTPTGVNRMEADLSSQASGNGTGQMNGPGVAVLDTGSGPHGDLNVRGGVNCASGRGYGDGNGHGTHVAGTIGALDNGVGVVGVAPGVPLYSVRVLNNNGSGSWSNIICGIEWVTENAVPLGIKVANMSLGGGGSDDGNCGATNNDALHQAVCTSVDAGVTYVVAAGNSAVDLAGSVPAAYDEVLTVTAMADFDGRPGGGAAATCRADVDDTAADFSNFAVAGSPDEGHAIAGPGVCIESTWKGGGYKTISGTSMAAPHVSGLATLCLARGSCTGSPEVVIAKLRGDAAQRPADYGFVGDPSNMPTTLYYGYLAYAGGS